MSGLKSLVILVTLSVLALSLAGCSAVELSANRLVGSGKAATRDYDVAAFNGIDINSAFKATVTRGDQFKVSVTADDNLIDYVNVTKVGDTLRVRYENGRFNSFLPRTGPEVRITMPELQSVTLNGASQATMSGFQQTSRFQSDLNGASRLNGEVKANDIRVSLQGASQATLNGTGRTLAVDSNGASRANLGSLAVDKASVTANGASHIAVNAGANLDYNLNGASSLTYAGNPAIGGARTEGASSATRQ